ncbi:MAG: DNA-binding protein [Candidatus Arcticimaribacter sp.]
MNYTVGDQVDLFIVRATQLGYVVLIDNEAEGLLFKSDVFQPLQKGDQVKGYIKLIREDDKIDVSLRPQGFRNAIDADCDNILSILKKDKVLNLTDKSSPEDIRSQLNMSKKAFKKAIGFLYKRKVIILQEDRIELLN